MANSVDPDQMPHPVASDLGLHFAKAYLPQYLGLLWYYHIYPNICYFEHASNA